MLVGAPGSLALWVALLVGSALAVARAQLRRGDIPWHVPAGSRILDALGPILLLLPAIFVSAWGTFGGLTPIGMLWGCGALVLVQVGRLFLAKLLGAPTARVPALELAAAHSGIALTLLVVLVLHLVPGHVAHGGQLQRALAVLSICFVGLLLLRATRDLAAADPPTDSWLTASVPAKGLPRAMSSVAQMWGSVAIAAVLGRSAIVLISSRADDAVGIVCGVGAFVLLHAVRARRIQPAAIHREVHLIALPIALVSGLAHVSWADAQHWVQQTWLAS